MSTENGKHQHGPRDDPNAPLEQPLTAEGEATYAVEEPDEPVNPDEATRAETAAARQVLSMPRRPARPYKGPRSIAIMLLVLGMVIFMGSYAISWALRIREQNQQGDLRKLDEREVMSTWQAEYKLRKWGPNATTEPPGTIYPPLTPEERSKYNALKAKFGGQVQPFKPDALQQAFINDVLMLRPEGTTQPATGPGTGPTPGP